MPAEVRRYRRRTPVVEAIRFDGRNGAAVAAWCGGSLTNRDGALVVVTSHAMPVARIGDYVVRELLPDGASRFYGMMGRVFEHAWEPAPPVG